MPPQGWEYAGPDLVRIVVPGGWIYQHTQAGCMCFVPHPQLFGGAQPPAPQPVPSPACAGASAGEWPGPEAWWP